MLQPSQDSNHVLLLIHFTCCLAMKTQFHESPGHCHWICWPVRSLCTACTVQNRSRCGCYCGTMRHSFFNLHFWLQAHKVCPSDPLACNELGVLTYRNQQYSAAEQWLLRALELVPGRLNAGGYFSGICMHMHTHTHRPLCRLYTAICLPSPPAVTTAVIDAHVGTGQLLQTVSDSRY